MAPAVTPENEVRAVVPAQEMLQRKTHDLAVVEIEQGHATALEHDSAIAITTEGIGRQIQIRSQLHALCVLELHDVVEPQAVEAGQFSALDLR